MDQAFIPLQKMIEGMTTFQEIRDEETGIHSYIYECGIDSPVELDVFRDEHGAVRIGSVPPLYRMDTTFRPVFHRLSFTARLEQD